MFLFFVPAFAALRPLGLQASQRLLVADGHTCFLSAAETRLEIIKSAAITLIQWVEGEALPSHGLCQLSMASNRLDATHLRHGGLAFLVGLATLSLAGRGKTR